MNLHCRSKNFNLLPKLPLTKDIPLSISRPVPDNAAKLLYIFQSREKNLHEGYFEPAMLYLLPIE